MLAEVTVAISFGVVMFLLALFSVWQGQRQRNQPSMLACHALAILVAHIIAGDVEQDRLAGPGSAAVMVRDNQGGGRQHPHHPTANSPTRHHGKPP